MSKDYSRQLFDKGKERVKKILEAPDFQWDSIGISEPVPVNLFLDDITGMWERLWKKEEKTIMEQFMKDPKIIECEKKALFSLNERIFQKTGLDVLFFDDKKIVPFYDVKNKEKYDRCWKPVMEKTDFTISPERPYCPDRKLKEIDTGSWFSMRKMNRDVRDLHFSELNKTVKKWEKEGDLEEDETDRMLSVINQRLYTEERKIQLAGLKNKKNLTEEEIELKKPLPRLKYDKPKANGMFKVRIYPQAEDRETMRTWFSGNRLIYNRCIDVINQIGILKMEMKKVRIPLVEKEIKDFQDKQENEREQFKGKCKKKFEARLLEEKKAFDEMMQEKEKQFNIDYCVNKEDLRFMLKLLIVEYPFLEDIPSAVRETAIGDALKARKTCMSNLVRGNIKSFNLQFKSKKRNLTDVIELPQNACKIADGKLRMYPKTIKNPIEMKNFYMTDFFYDIKLMCNRPTNKWYLLVPRYKFHPKQTEKLKTISLDPGSRSFLTGYSIHGEVLKIGHEDNYKLKRLTNRIDDIQSYLDKYKTDKKQRKRMRKRQAILRKRVHDKVNEVHRKAALYLCSNYNIIVLPKFGITQIAKTASRLTTRNLYTWSHFTFRELLKAKAKQFPNCRVIGDTEEYTSKTCSNCGCLNDVGNAEIYRCRKCKVVLDRDINGAINIFYKAINDL